jgi:hypothetical protein
LVLAVQPGQAQDTQANPEEGTQAGAGDDFDYAEYWFAVPESARAFYASGLRDGINLVVARELAGGSSEGLSQEALTGSVRNRLEDKWRGHWITFGGREISSQMDLLYGQSGNANMALDAAAKLAIDQLSGRAPGPTGGASQGDEEKAKQD